MKKNLLALSLVLFLTAGISQAGIFDSNSSSTGGATSTQKVSLTPVKNQTTPQTTNKTISQTGQFQKESFEAAIQNLDSAQVEVRDELAKYTQIYNEALTRYNASKEECRTLRAQIRTIKNKIRTIERTKKSINKQIIKYYENN